MQPTQPTDVQHEGVSQSERGPDQQGVPGEDEVILVHRTPFFRRFLTLYLVLLTLLLLAIIPPLITFNRLQRRIASSIGLSLGRPVHLDRVSLTLLPLPGFTLENFVVSEDPAFGEEPVIRAGTVRATLRVSSLWSRRVEFSTISLADPSVNLVHNSDGRWNVQSILLQASRMPAAPTAQRNAGPSPRFPYIEATGARVNIKNGAEKLPFSLTEADFALWLPDPREWRLRLSGKPVRTNTVLTSDTGIVDLEATLKRAQSLSEVPLSLTARWHNVPMGQASRVLLGHDAGWSGDMNLSASATGTLGQSTLHTRLQASGVRRADFVPDHTLSIDAGCIADASALFHTFTNIRCSWPPETTSEPKTLALTGAIPDIHQLDSMSLSIGTPGIAAPILLDWIRVLSSRIPSDVSATGILSGSFAYGSPIAGARAEPVRELRLSHATLSSAALGADPIAVSSLVLRPQSAAALGSGSRQRGRKSAAYSASAAALQLTPTEIDLGGREPAILDGTLTVDGCTLHLAGPVVTSRLLSLARVLPQFGDGLAEALPAESTQDPLVPGAAETIASRPEVIRIDLTSTRLWSGPQTWSPTQSHSHPTVSRRRSRR